MNTCHTEETMTTRLLFAKAFMELLEGTWQALPRCLSILWL